MLYTHGEKVPFEPEKDYPEWWDWWITHNADCASKWYETLINAGENQKEVPVLWIRFEDLVTNP